jgi:YtoQ family protein
MTLTVYLSGEIHSPWREEIIESARTLGLPIQFLAPITHHQDSDTVGAVILGEEEKPFWRDHVSAKINGIRTRTGLQQADVVIVKFGEKYRQWNAAFDAGYAAALEKQLIIIHPEEFTHSLKEVDASAAAVCTTAKQAVEILSYVCRQN